MDNLKAQGTKAFIWDFVGKMTTHGMGFIVSIFLARILEPSDFGLIAMVMVIIGVSPVFLLILVLEEFLYRDEELILFIICL